MRIIGLEEHFALPPKPGAPRGLPPLEKGSLVGAPWHLDPGTGPDMDEKRIANMDKDGVDIQVISTPFAQNFPAETAVEQAREINDHLAAAVKRHPDRYRGFAAIPTAVPEACAEELERCVKEHGFVGSLIGNRLGGTEFLAQPKYEAYFAKSEELDVPIYLHPGPPNKEVIDSCYSHETFSPEMVSVFSRFGYGWHVDVGIHMLQLILTGVFDRYPNLQIIMGHWGELLPFYIDRFDDTMPKEFTGLKHDPSYYLRNNMYVTSSGINTPEAMEFCHKILGADRLMFSADYPFAPFAGSEKLFENPNISLEDREKFAHGNAERLLKL